MSSPALRVVVGLGKTGLSCVRYCVDRDLPVVVTDSRPEPPGLSELRACYPNVVAKLGGFDHSIMSSAAELYVSPGVSLREPAVAACIEAGIPALGDIEIFVRHVSAPIVAITGSNGKSTVTTLVGDMARHAGVRAKVGGNLGLPVLDMLGRHEPDLYVLELSSFQLETTHSLAALCAVNLNVTPDHMDRYASFDEYRRAKLHVYHNACAAIVNLDDPGSYGGTGLVENCVSFSVNPKSPADFHLRNKDGKLQLMHKKSVIMAANEFPLIGRHQLANALAALAIGTACDFPQDAMVEALKTFTGLPHRCEFVAEVDGVRWYNDSKGTNVGATSAAITGIGSDLDGKIVLIAGGQAKDADFKPLRDVMSKYVSKLIVFGEDKRTLFSAFQDVVSTTMVDVLTDAVDEAKDEAQSGDAVLLSPACASFDMFKNFEDRGEKFCEIVRGLGQQ